MCRNGLYVMEPWFLNVSPTNRLVVFSLYLPIRNEPPISFFLFGDTCNEGLG